jgi:hypothetical protein
MLKKLALIGMQAARAATEMRTLRFQSGKAMMVVFFFLVTLVHHAT